MRIIERLPTGSSTKLRIGEGRLDALKSWITTEIEDALSARFEQEMVWREAIRMYEGVPRNPTRNFPIENAPNIEVTIGAIACDAIYAQALDTIFTASPIVTARGTNSEYVDDAKAVQSWLDYIVQNELNLREAAEHFILDDTQLGTGVFYAPWVEFTKKTSINKITMRSPRMISIAPEDFLLRGGADANLQLTPWVGMRSWLSEGDLTARAEKPYNWNVEGFIPVGNVGWVRTQREWMGHTRSNRKINLLYEVFEVYAHFDIDGDGLEEDIYFVWDRSSRNIAYIDYNPYDVRPFEAARYQLRAHLFYGLGVMEMLRCYQEEVTEIHNSRNLNMLLANARMWLAREGTIAETTRIWPGKVQFVNGSPREDIMPSPMADIYPSSGQAEQITMTLAERRVGLQDLGAPRPGSMMGSRTPGITALSFLQQVNRRFTPAFDGMRLAIAGAIRQCVYRYQERLLAGDDQVADHIREVAGAKQGETIISLLKNQRFDQLVAIEVTASSASINREADRQNALQLVGILGGYYEKTLQLVAIAANPQTPEPVRDVAKKIAESAGEIIDRTIRTFDQVRDPARFIIDVEAELDATAGLSQQGLAGLAQLMGPGANNGMPAAPGAEGLPESMPQA